METPKIPRLSSEEERRQIKVRTKQLVDLAGGGEFFAPVTGVDKAALSKYGGLAYPDSFIRADVILELDRQIGAPMMVETLAKMLGYRLVPIDDDPGARIGVSDLTALHREGGELAGALSQALEDGDVDSDERRNIRPLVARKIATLHRLDRKLAGEAA